MADVPVVLIVPHVQIVPDVNIVAQEALVEYVLRLLLQVIIHHRKRNDWHHPVIVIRLNVQLQQKKEIDVKGQLLLEVNAGSISNSNNCLSTDLLLV
ncbi:hypothetical protein [Solitalea longa]|uniref:hypothetical protein n=1 Tax=Solitalea longa TaxID=2079460 RepID=UPI0013FD1695|nr:hypothetical protein [Solitalea longa]